MAPVHADEGNGPVPAVCCHGRERARQEGGKLRLAHLARRHVEFPVANAAQSGHMAIDRHIIWRIREDEIGGLVAHEQPIGVGLARIAADQTVVAQLPDIAAPGRRLHREVWNCIQ